MPSYGIAQPLSQDDVDQAAEAAATPQPGWCACSPRCAARTGAIRAAQLDDVDLGNRRLNIAGRIRPIDEFTHQILLDWLDYRRTRPSATSRTPACSSPPGPRSRIPPVPANPRARTSHRA